MGRSTVERTPARRVRALRGNDSRRDRPSHLAPAGLKRHSLRPRPSLVSRFWKAVLKVADVLSKSSLSGANSTWRLARTSGLRLVEPASAHARGNSTTVRQDQVPYHGISRPVLGHEDMSGNAVSDLGEEVIQPLAVEDTRRRCRNIPGAG